MFKVECLALLNENDREDRELLRESGVWAAASNQVM